jgi:hypothetical protein
MVGRIWNGACGRQSRGERGTSAPPASTSLELEFVTASGKTQALVTLRLTDVRRVADNDLVAVRTLDRTV